MSLQTLCGLFGYTRQAYYKQLKRNASERFADDLLILRIKDIRKDMPRIGTRKLYYRLNESGFVVSRDYLFDLLRNNRMLVKKYRKYTKTTDSRHWMRKYPNLIRGFDFDKPNLVWVSDITYISIKDDYAYLALITDVYSRKILGHSLSRNLAADGPLNALKMALENTADNDRKGLIHHSDRGTQYCCKDYVQLLGQNDIRISMTENGDPYENALAERVNGILKTEWLDLERFGNFEQAQKRINEVIEIYNSKRPHMSCDMLTPDQAYRLSGKLKKHWRKNTQLRKNNTNLHPNP